MVTSKQVISALMLPDGSHRQSLQITVTVTLFDSVEHHEESGLISK
jgi:hypothetical protein